MRRCIYCRRWIWPWQDRGWKIGLVTSAFWHPKCWIEES